MLDHHNLNHHNPIDPHMPQHNLPSPKNIHESPWSSMVIRAWSDKRSTIPIRMNNSAVTIIRLCKFWQIGSHAQAQVTLGCKAAILELKCCVQSPATLQSIHKFSDLFIACGKCHTFDQLFCSIQRIHKFDQCTSSRWLATPWQWEWTCFQCHPQGSQWLENDCIADSVRLNSSSAFSSRRRRLKNSGTASGRIWTVCGRSPCSKEERCHLHNESNVFRYSPCFAVASTAGIGNASFAMKVIPEGRSMNKSPRRTNAPSSTDSVCQMW